MNLLQSPGELGYKPRDTVARAKRASKYHPLPSELSVISCTQTEQAGKMAKQVKHWPTDLMGLISGTHTKADREQTLQRSSSDLQIEGT